MPVPPLCILEPEKIAHHIPLSVLENKKYDSNIKYNWAENFTIVDIEINVWSSLFIILKEPELQPI